MRVKIFRAPTLRAAIALLREELGPDALLLSSQEGEDSVEVTAAIEPPDGVNDDLERFDEVPPPPPATALVESFVWHNLAPVLVDALSPRPGETLADACARRFRFHALPGARDTTATLLCGPPGAGRSTAIAAMARRCLAAGRVPMVITADTRPGAAETLAAMIRTLGLTLIVANRPETMLRALARRGPQMPVLIDTPPLDAFDPASVAAIAALARTTDTASALVLPAGMDPLEAAEFAAEATRQMGEIDRLVITRLDDSGRLGGPLAACLGGDLALGEICRGDGTILPLTPDVLAGRLAGRRPARAQVVPRADTAAAPAPRDDRWRPRETVGGAATTPLIETPGSRRHAALLTAHIAAQRARS